MNKKIIWLLIFLIFIVGLGSYLLINQNLVKSFSEKSFEFVEKNISNRVNTPGPLRKEVDDEGAQLSVKGAIAETNRHRREAGLPELEENALLNIAAQKKVDDMFARQYFEHDAPTGEGAGDLVSGAGYEFIVVGENLALGNYKNDAVLVQAWMDSPGHRENILKSSYTEIGIAVARGTFEGRSTWLAVQHFAKPISACPDINEGLKAQIDSNNEKLDNLKLELESRKSELENKPTTREESEEYNRKVDEYNALVNEYNTLLENTKSLVASYNSQVQSFNECAKN
jgi:uncharacterized protein YkwD